MLCNMLCKINYKKTLKFLLGLSLKIRMKGYIPQQLTMSDDWARSLRDSNKHTVTNRHRSIYNS